MESIMTYFRSIIIFMIFTNFVTILLPNQKYKKYVDFVLGLILIAIVISPFSKIINFEVSQFTTKNTEEVKYTDDTQYTLQLYQNQLSKLICENVYNNFNIIPTDVRVVVDNEDLSKITYIEMTLPKEESKQGEIAIDKIEISEEKDVESDNTKNIKNFISGAYNLSEDNIHIK